MSKKENNTKFFLGGTVVGVAAGYVIGKLLHSSSTSTIKNEVPGTNIDSDEYKNLRGGHHQRSKSAARYEGNIPSQISLNNSDRNINKPISRSKSNTNLSKISDFDKDWLYKANKENVIQNDLRNEHINVFDVAKNSKENSMKSDMNDLSIMRPKTSFKARNTENLNIVNDISIVTHSTELSNDVFNNSTSSVNFTNLATCNSISNFQGDEEENKDLHSPCAEEFSDNDLISSTRRSISDYI